MTRGGRPHFGHARGTADGASGMETYLLSWILGVPVIVPVIIYVIFN